MLPGDYVRALELLMDAVEEPIIGTVTAQNGSSTTCNGWVASAVLGTLVIDAAGDGRAHPTGKMGSFGLAAEPRARDRPGGRRRQPRAGPLPRGASRAARSRHTANVLRTASVESGGFISAARNPLPASFVAAHAAVGAISFALDLGDALLAAEPRRRAGDDRRRRRASGRRDPRPRRGAREGAAHRERVRHRQPLRRRARAGLRQRVPHGGVGRRAPRDLPGRARDDLARERADHLDRRHRRRATRSPCCTCPRPTSRSATGSRSPASTPRSRRCSASRSPSTRLPDSARIAERLEALWAIAHGPGGGADRPAFSPAEASAMTLVAGWAAQAGLEPAIDAHGNLWALPDRTGTARS